MSQTLLIVDDEKHTREGLRRSLEDEFDVYVAADLTQASHVLENESVDLLLTDLRLGAGEDGLTLIDQALRRPNPPVCIMMTAYGSVDTAVEAMKRGAYDFVTKPVNLDRLEVLVRRALRERRTEAENRDLRQQVDKRAGLERIVGRSAAIEAIFDTVRQVAPTPATVLIEGENGTGKELVAHAVHDLSKRARNRFVAVHCAALSPQLLESELFGHEKGAFTGATERRPGRFEQADGGTLFLDEIGEIDPSTQVKLLRVLSERQFERVGGNQTVKVDVRVVAATNRELERMVARGEFREDLFYRLNVVRVRLPALRERREDIPLLVATFLRQSAQENEKPARELTADAMNRLLEYPWPGNVRQLRAAVDHGVVLAQGPKITLRDLPAEIRQWTPGAEEEREGPARPPGRPRDGGAAPPPSPWPVPRAPGDRPRDPVGAIPGGAAALNLEDTERRLIERALDETRGNVSRAAERLGISRRTLHRKLRAWRAAEAGGAGPGPGEAGDAPDPPGVPDL